VHRSTVSDDREKEIMVPQSRLTLLLTLLAACTFGRDATSSVIHTNGTPSPYASPSSTELLPLHPPTFPDDGDVLLRMLLDPTTDGAARMLSGTSEAALPRKTPILAKTSPSTVNPEVLITRRVNRPVFDPANEKADYTLPEPASILLLLTGLIGLTARRQMRKSHAEFA